jgi:hypothetical protein
MQLTNRGNIPSTTHSSPCTAVDCRHPSSTQGAADGTASSLKSKIPRHNLNTDDPKGLQKICKQAMSPAGPSMHKYRCSRPIVTTSLNVLCLDKDASAGTHSMFHTLVTVILSVLGICTTFWSLAESILSSFIYGLPKLIMMRRYAGQAGL